MIKKFLSWVMPKAVEGGLYSTRDEDGVRIIKVLKVDSVGVHVRFYSNRYEEHPTAIDPSALYMAGVKDEHNNPGVGHMPIRKDTFLSWSRKLHGVAPVTEEELEGYRMWEEANGGYF